jgi:hypothetical protein
MMNELIKKLMLKAGGVLAPAYVTDENDNSVWTENAKVDTIDMDAEYFAKLLVREYGNIVLHYTDVDEGVKVANKHFGA